MYLHIFYTNILKQLDLRGETKEKLAARAGVSISFMSDITTAKGNPSLKTMEKIAHALDMPLPLLLESTDLDRAALEEMSEGRTPQSLPPGYERVSAVLPSLQAYQVRQWDEAARKKLRAMK